jgi:8-oxo-dGTP pyrophosphatase MutT (NUDIX family)
MDAGRKEERKKQTVTKRFHLIYCSKNRIFVDIKSVLGIVFDEEKLLLAKRKDVPVWVLPGGGVDPGELPEEAIIREFREEVSLDVEVIRRVGTYTGGFFIKPVHLYHLKIVQGEISPGDEIKEVNFFPLANLPKEIPPPFHEFIQDAVAKKPPFSKKITSVTIFTVLATVLKHPILFTRFILSRLGLHVNT